MEPYGLWGSQMYRIHYLSKCLPINCSVAIVIQYFKVLNGSIHKKVFYGLLLWVFLLITAIKYKIVLEFYIEIYYKLNEHYIKFAFTLKWSLIHMEWNPKWNPKFVNMWNLHHDNVWLVCSNILYCFIYCKRICW